VKYANRAAPFFLCDRSCACRSRLQDSFGGPAEDSAQLRRCTQCSADVSHTGADVFLQWTRLHALHTLVGRVARRSGGCLAIRIASTFHASACGRLAHGQRSVSWSCNRRRRKLTAAGHAGLRVPQMGLLGSLQSLLLRQPRTVGSSCCRSLQPRLRLPRRRRRRQRRQRSHYSSRTPRTFAVCRRATPRRRTPPRSEHWLLLLHAAH